MSYGAKRWIGPGRVLCIGAVMLGSAAQAQAKVVRIVIDKVEAAASGPYERISGQAFGELEPADALNARITVIQGLKLE